ncbi:aldolase/citrate lyase family protein, partial [Cyanobium gracile]
MEHSGLGIEGVKAQCAFARAAGIVPMVRLPRPDPGLAPPLLDAGALGIMMPLVESAAQARALVDACRYRPEGRRGLAFGLAATPCTTPVLAVLLAWMAQSGQPLVGMLLLCSFGAGQVMPLLLAGTMAASLPGLLQLRRLGQWVPPISGVVLLASGGLTLLSVLP